MLPGSGGYPRAPVFFFSYAHPSNPLRRSTPADRDVHQHAARFFDDVSEHVSELLGTSTGEAPGFMDRVMGGGEHWNEELRGVLGTCQVFVAMLSSRYCRSEWFLREWHVFAERGVRPRRHGVSSNGTTIIPVIWSDGYLDNLPKMIEAVQPFVPYKAQNQTAIDLYLQRGVYGLLASNSPELRDAYQEVTWFLANRIREVYANYIVDPGVPPESWEQFGSSGDGPP